MCIKRSHFFSYALDLFYYDRVQNVSATACLFLCLSAVSPSPFVSIAIVFPPSPSDSQRIWEESKPCLCMRKWSVYPWNRCSAESLSIDVVIDAKHDHLPQITSANTCKADTNGCVGQSAYAQAMRCRRWHMLRCLSRTVCVPCRLLSLFSNGKFLFENNDSAAPQPECDAHKRVIEVYIRAIELVDIGPQ